MSVGSVLVQRHNIEDVSRYYEVIIQFSASNHTFKLGVRVKLINIRQTHQKGFEVIQYALESVVQLQNL